MIIILDRFQETMKEKSTIPLISKFKEVKMPYAKDDKESCLKGDSLFSLIDKNKQDTIEGFSRFSIYFLSSNLQFTLFYFNKKSGKQSSSLRQITTMLHTFSADYKYFSTQFLASIKSLSKSHDVQDIYFTERCYSIVRSFVSLTDIVGCGCQFIHTKEKISPYLKVQKIIVVANIEKSDIQEVKQFAYLFPKIYLQTLHVTRKSYGREILKEWNGFKDVVKTIQQINFDFGTCLDGAYFVGEWHLRKKNQSEELKVKQLRKMNFQSRMNAFRSFLTAFPKIYEYELHYQSKFYSSNSAYKKAVKQLQAQMKQCLQTIEQHSEQCKNYDQSSSPKIKFLVINRQILSDFMSPMIYSYYYGPLCEELIRKQQKNSILDQDQYLTSQGKMYNSTFEKDLDQTSSYIKTITDDKTILNGPFEANYFHKAKKIITQIKDPSPLQISLHIAMWKSCVKFAQQRQETAALQQSLINRIDQGGRQISNGKAVSLVEQWMLNANQKQVTMEEYLKLVLLTEVSGSLWFFQRSSLKEKLQLEFKQNYKSFVSKNKNLPKQPLKEKAIIDSDNRPVLYRHEPPIVKICSQWIHSTLALNKKQQYQNCYTFDKIPINNKLAKNRQSKLIIVVDGVMGYNQLAMLKRMMKDVAKDKQISIISQAFMNSKEYIDFMRCYE